MITPEEVRREWKVRTIRTLRMIAELGKTGATISIKNVHDALLRKYEKVPADLPETAIIEDVWLLKRHGLVSETSLAITEEGSTLIALMAERSRDDPLNFGQYMAEKSSSPSRRNFFPRLAA